MKLTDLLDGIKMGSSSTGSMDGGNNPGTEYFKFNRIGRSTGSTSYSYAPSLGIIKEFKIFNRALRNSNRIQHNV